MKLSDLSDEQTKLLAKKMGFEGPMHLFQDFINSKPKKMATGGLVTASSNPLQTPNPVVPEVEVLTQKGNPAEIIDRKAGDIVGGVRVDETMKAAATQADAPTDVKTVTAGASLTGDKIEGVLDQFETAQGTVEKKSTVQGQLEGLMSQFKDGEVPAWAAGAIRNANTIMAQRGISSSSMAGQAVLQSAMESALPIAQQDATTNFQMQLTNLNNEQQTLMAKNQARVDSLFTDTAQKNATAQFNATSQNQTQQFMASLKSNTEQFNVAQVNAMRQFNAGEANARSLFKANMVNQRQQFNASNRLVIDQSNAAWRRTISTQNNATINEANRIDAAAKLELSVSEMNNDFQARRDLMNFAFSAGENEKDRSTQLILANMSSDEADKARNQKSRDDLYKAAGSFVASFWR